MKEIVFRFALFKLSFIVLAGFPGATAQMPYPEFERDLQAALKSAAIVDEVERLHNKVERQEKVSLQNSRNDGKKYCHNITNFLVLRVELHRALIFVVLSEMGPKSGPLNSFEIARLLERLSNQRVFSAKRMAVGKLPELIVNNAESIRKRFAEASQKCASDDPVSEDFLNAKFSHTWLLSNYSVLLTLDDRTTRDELTVRIIEDYEDVLKAIRSRSSTTKVDSFPILYSYANFLLWGGNARFEEADLILTECLNKAIETYGATSPNLLPILRLKAGLANAVNDPLESEKLRTFISKINPSIKAEDPVLFDLASRATSESRRVLDSTKGAITVMGTRAELDAKMGKPDGKRTEADALADLPRPGPPMQVFEPSVIFSSESERATVVIDVDELGIVRNAEVQHREEKVRAELAKLALGLKFTPLIYKGRVSSMKGIVYLNFKRKYN